MSEYNRHRVTACDEEECNDVRPSLASRHIIMADDSLYFHLFVVSNVYALKLFNEVVDEPYMVRPAACVSTWCLPRATGRTISRPAGAGVLQE